MLFVRMLKIGLFEMLNICILANYVLSLYQQKGDKKARCSHPHGQTSGKS